MYSKAEELLDDYLGNIRKYYKLSLLNDMADWINAYLNVLEGFAYIGLIGDDELYDRTTFVQHHFIERDI